MFSWHFYGFIIQNTLQIFVIFTNFVKYDILKYNFVNYKIGTYPKFVSSKLEFSYSIHKLCSITSASSGGISIGLDGALNGTFWFCVDRLTFSVDMVRNKDILGVVSISRLKCSEVNVLVNLQKYKNKYSNYIHNV